MDLNKERKLIFIISFCPKYVEYGGKPRPYHNWDTPNGSWVGIWDSDWGDILCRALAEHYPEYNCEVWRPDLRADRIYTARFTERFSHSNFPARLVKRFRRGRLVREVHSLEMLHKAKEIDFPDTVVLFPARNDTKWLRQLRQQFNRSNLIHFNFLSTGLLLPQFVPSGNIFKLANRFLIMRAQKSLLRGIRSLLTTSDNPEALAQLRREAPWIRLPMFRWGLDTDFWQAMCSKEQAKKQLGIEADDCVIVLSQRLIPEYQLDRFLEALAKAKAERAYHCYITGHGLKEYEDHLVSLRKELNLDGTVDFVGYVPDEQLRMYFTAADLFATLALSSAGSGSAIKAMAVGAPVMHTNSGSTYHYLRGKNAGALVGTSAYQDWTRVLEDVINGKQIITVPRKQIEHDFGWASNIGIVHKAIQDAVKG